MLEAIGYVLWLTVVFTVYAVALALAVAVWLLEWLLHGLRAGLWEVRLWAERQFSAQELAVARYPEPKRARPRLRVPPVNPLELH
jgi:hypothetical protein